VGDVGIAIEEEMEGSLEMILNLAVECGHGIAIFRTIDPTRN
jgi:hypothetical protein